MAITYLEISYPNFTLGQIIDPEEANQNNSEIVEKINTFIDDINASNIASVSAVTKANTAVASSSEALTKANTAIIDSALALGQSNTAVADSSEALTKANTAIEVSSEAQLLVPQMEQAVADVADKASVAYVNQVASDFILGKLGAHTVTEEMLAFDVATQAEHNAHLNETMPHKFVDGGVMYRWGFSVVDGVAMINYEEVV